MKKVLKKLCTLVMALSLCLPAAACSNGGGGGGGSLNGGGGGDDPSSEAVDNSRTQLYVYNYNGGYGYDWLVAAKTRYEALHAEDEWEPGTGRKGVQVLIKNQKTTANYLTDVVDNNREEVYFVENVFYQTFLNSIGDITEAVKGDLSEYGDEAGTTIESKLTDRQKDYLQVADENGEKHYYAVPHYAGYRGIIYNVDLFDEYGYYFLPEEDRGDTLAEKFVSRSQTQKSVGIDGIAGTSDDGLPTTYDEFFELCDYIASTDFVPVEWPGGYSTLHVDGLLTALVADYEGVDGMGINYDVKGTATDLIKLDGGAFDPTNVESLEINPTNGAELGRQAGRYYAADFIRKLATTEKYHNSTAFTGGHSQLDAQDDFLQAGYDGITPRTAMLLDGVWWEQEASDTFDYMVSTMGEDFSRTNRNFGYMPLPKATKEKLAEYRAAGKEMTLIDENYCLCFMKKSVEEWKKPLIYDFIKFMNSNESLREFTRVTNTTKALQYSMTDEQMEGMSPFGKSLIKLQNSSNVFYPVSNESFYLNNASSFSPQTMFQSRVSGSNYHLVGGFADNKLGNTESAFRGMYEFYKTLPWAKA